MTKFLVFISISVVVLMGCSTAADLDATQICNEFELEAGNYESSEDFKIMNAIAQAFFSDGAEVHLIQKTDIYPDEILVKDILETNKISYDPAALIDYSENNTATSIFSNSPNGEGMKLITNEEIQCFFETENGWNRFYSKYPNSYGYLTFTKPGYSENGDFAIITYSNTRGLDNGIGDFAGSVVVLDKINGTWTIREIVVFLLS
jgi:hypothetical protein